jgi:hypothetical protein
MSYQNTNFKHELICSTVVFISTQYKVSAFANEYLTLPLRKTVEFACYVLNKQFPHTKI